MVNYLDHSMEQTHSVWYSINASVVHFGGGAQQINDNPPSVAGSAMVLGDPFLFADDLS